MTRPNEPLQFLINAGEGGVHILGNDWSKTSLGPARHWPDDLKITLNIILNNAHPKLLCWGTDLICLYNSAYSRFTGSEKKGVMLGQPLAEALPSVWEKIKDSAHDFFQDHSNGQIEVRESRLSLKGERTELLYICNPVFNAEGYVKGLILTVRPQTTHQPAPASADIRLAQQFITSAPVGMLSLTGYEFTVTTVNKAFLSLTRRTEEDVVGRPFFSVFPLLRGSFEPILQNVLWSGESFYGDQISIPITIDQQPDLLYLNIVLEPARSDTGAASLLAVVTDVTSIVRQKKRLAEEEARFKKAFSEAHFAVVQLKGPDYIVEYGNDRLFSEYLKIPGADAIGKPLFSLFPAVGGHPLKKELDAVFTSGISIHKKDDNRLHLKEGERYFDYDISPLTGDSGSIIGLMVTVYDVTDRMESHLKEKAARYRLELALDAGGVGFWEVDLRFEKLSYSTRLAEVFDLPEREISIQALRGRIHPGDRQRVEESCRNAISSGEYTDEFRIIKENGSIGWLRVKGKIFFDADERPSKLIGTSRDITADKKKELELWRKESRLRHLILEAPVGIGILRGPDYRLETINELGAKLLGRPKEELEGKPILEVVTEVDTVMAKQLLDRVFYHDEKISESEYPVKLLREGSPERLYMHFAYEPLKNLQGKTIGVIVVGFDMTSQVLTRKKIEKSEARFRVLANDAPNFVWTMDLESRVGFINDTFQEYCGLGPEQLNSGGFETLFHPDDIAGLVEKWEAVSMSGEPLSGEHRIRRKDGVYRWYLTKAIPEKPKGGKPAGWIFTSTDIHDIKEQDIQKDYFISRASHELKTPLTSLKGYIQILQSIHGGSMDQMLVHSLRKMSLQVDRLTRLINDLLDTTRINNEGLSIHKTHFSMVDLISETVEELQPSSACQIVFHPAEFGVVVSADREKLAQVLNNLLTNAIKYSPDCESVWIKGSRTHNGIRISIIDKGIGIDLKAQKKIFDRFYRVSGKSEETFPGLGIGLYIANEILRLHDSTLEVESVPDHGSVFSFHLSIVEEDLANGQNGSGGAASE